jgi:phage head maturation protease
MGTDNPAREDFARSVVAAAERGDRLAFAAAAGRLGSLAEAQDIVRTKAVLRMADRVTTAVPPPIGYMAMIRANDGPTSSGDHLYGHFTVWDTWYEVDSLFEGHFLERTVRGSTKKTIEENGSQMRVLFQHGQDPVAGDKPLGAIEELREDKTGAYYSARLLRGQDGELVDYVRGIVPGIEAGLYSASFRFQVMRELFDYETEASDYNPDGLPERTLKEMRVMEFGPVTFPANPAATASVRSRPDENSANGDGAQKVTVAPPEPDAAASRTSGNERREPSRFRTDEEFLSWLTQSAT